MAILNNQFVRKSFTKTEEEKIFSGEGRLPKKVKIVGLKFPKGTLKRRGTISYCDGFFYRFKSTSAFLITIQIHCQSGYIPSNSQNRHKINASGFRSSTLTVLYVTFLVSQ